MDLTLPGYHHNSSGAVCRIDPATPAADLHHPPATRDHVTPHARRAGETDPNGVRLLAQDAAELASRYRAAGLVTLGSSLDRVADQAVAAATVAERIALAEPRT